MPGSLFVTRIVLGSRVVRRGKLLLNPRMVNDPSAPAASVSAIHALAAARGLAPALACCAQAVEAAAERAMRPLPPCPAGPLTEPAAVFSPVPGPRPR